jgi:hypothetical protein
MIFFFIFAFQDYLFTSYYLGGEGATVPISYLKSKTSSLYLRNFN